MLNIIFKIKSLKFILLFTIRYSLFTILCYGQVKTESVELNKNEELVEIINIGNKGFLIETINTSTYKVELRHYSTELLKQWDTPINLLNAKFTTSANRLSDYAYITNQTYQIDLKNKEVKKFQLPEVPNGRILKSDFMNSRYWYTLYYIKFSGQYLIRRVEHKLVNIPQSTVHSSTTTNAKNATPYLKEFNLQLPKQTDYKYSSEYCYLSNNNHNIMLCQKTTGYLNINRNQNNKINYQIVNLDTSLQVKNKINIQVDLGNHYVYPSQNFRKGREYPTPALDFTLTTINGKDLNVPKPDAYSSIIYNPNSKNIYIYGLLGSIPYYEKDNKSVIDGYFIYKYDSLGNLVNKVISKLPNDTILYGGYEVKTLLTCTPDNKIVFQIYFDKIKMKLSVTGIVYSFVYVIAKTGHELTLQNSFINKVSTDLGQISDPLIYDYVIKNLQHFDFILYSSNFSGAVEYYNALSPKEQKNSIFRLYRNNTENILIQDASNNGLINMMMFK